MKSRYQDLNLNNQETGFDVDRLLVTVMKYFLDVSWQHLSSGHDVIIILGLEAGMF